MLQKRIDLFWGLVFSPIGIALLLGVSFCVILLFRKEKLFWYFLAAMALVSSFVEFHNEFVDTPPPLAGPLQPLRLYGRAISILLLMLLVIYALIKRKGSLAAIDHFGIASSLWFIQTLILVKNIFYGNALEGILSYFIFVLLIFLMRFTASQLRNIDTIITANTAFVLAVIIFHVFSLYQSRVDFSPMIFPAGQFLGMTGNAQHAAVLLASSLPLFVFLIAVAKNISRFIFFAVGLLVTFYYLILTASRTGTVMAASTIMVFALLGGSKSVARWTAAFVFILLAMSVMDYNPLADLNKKALEHYTSTENSREQVIETQWRMFNDNILFGADPKGKRVGFAESSYFGVAASLGIVGLIPLFVLMAGCVRLIWKLWQTSFRDKQRRNYYLMAIGGLVPLLIGALVEAYLLGIVTWPLVLFLLYVAYGNYLLNSRVARMNSLS